MLSILNISIKIIQLLLNFFYYNLVKTPRQHDPLDLQIIQ